MPVEMIASSQRQATVLVRPQTTETMQYASMGERFIASLIHLMLLAIATGVVAIPFGIAAWMGSLIVSPFAAAVSSASFSMLFFISWMLYYSYFESTSGQTLGKRAMSIKVVDQVSGRTVDLPRAAVRSLLRIIDFLPVLYFIGFISCVATPRKQRIGDIAAGTVVVKA